LKKRKNSTRKISALREKRWSFIHRFSGRNSSGKCSISPTCISNDWISQRGGMVLWFYKPFL